MRWNKFRSSDGEYYSESDIITIIFLLLISTMNLSMVGSSMPSLITARIAGRFAFNIIEHVPDIKANEEGTKIVTKVDIKGKIEF